MTQIQQSTYLRRVDTQGPRQIGLADALADHLACQQHALAR
ncbi:hypothetical protein [Castellaniella ginsengisoli]|uniref:Uncharacterized protein n=1 Tax=Castellaniella ginsengisoli TaxID=546114 RepID=A0AB39D753_9BURK